MSQMSTDTLSQDKIQRLLAAVGTTSQPDASCDVDAVDFDWRQPRFFTLSQIKKVEAFAKDVADGCVEQFSQLYQAKMETSLVSAEQYFQHQLDQENENGGYYIAFGTNAQNPFGLVNIPNSSAAVWAGQLLGDAESTTDPDRELSTLEESFLLDIASGLIEAVSGVYGANLQIDRCVLRDRSTVALQGSEELFVITFEVRKSESDEQPAQASFLLCCDALRQVAGDLETQEAKTPAENTAAMQRCIHTMPLSLTAQLAKTKLFLKDVMDLQVNDVVLLDKTIMEPVEILFEDRTIFNGRPVQLDGNHAVLIEQTGL